jgi:hypothetical protein
VDRQGEVEAAEVGLLERAEERQPAAEPVAAHYVHRLGGADAGRDQRDGFPFQRVLQPVADEARHVGVDRHRRQARRGQRPHRRVDHRRARAGRPDDLDQRDQVGRVPEVGAHHALRMGQPVGDPPDRDGGRVRGQRDARWGHRVQLGEDLPLDREALRGRLDDQVGAFAGRRDAVRGPDPAHDLLGVDPQQPAGAGHPVGDGVPRLSARVVDGHRRPGGGEDLRDRRTHPPAADDGQPLRKLAGHDAVYPPSTYTIWPVTKSEAGDSR